MELNFYIVKGLTKYVYNNREEGSQNLPLKRAAARKSTSISEAYVPGQLSHTYITHRLTYIEVW